MAWRIQRFMRFGLSESAAEKLADRLADRDYEERGQPPFIRTVCLECSGLQVPGTCLPAQQGRIPHVSKHTDWRAFMPVRDVLQRCPAFDFATPA